MLYRSANTENKIYKEGEVFVDWDHKLIHDAHSKKLFSL